jgi:hypothetical protein
MAKTDWTEISKELTTPFPSTVVKERVMATNADKTAGMLASYVDARDVEERLDSAVGAGEWSFSWSLIDPDRKAVKGTLTILGVTKEDVGYPNGPEDKEPLKSAVSDALKRAAVQFGVGRHLYSEETRWVEINDKGFPIKDDKGEYKEVARQVSTGSAPRKTQEELMQELGMDAKQVAPKCGKCGSTMALRKGSRGPFWGCSNYPTCKNLYNISDVELDGTVTVEQGPPEDPANEETINTEDLPF